jgi:hypothetical protein
MSEIIGWENNEIIGLDNYVGDAFVGDPDIDRLMAMGQVMGQDAGGMTGHPLPPTAARTVQVVKAQQGLWKKHYLPLTLVPPLTTVAAGGQGVLQNSPQRLFKPTRLIIPSDVAGLFSVTGIFIGVKAQLVANGAIPARLFSEQSFDSGFEGDTAQVSQVVSVNVTNNSLGASPISAGMRGLTVM